MLEGGSSKEGLRKAQRTTCVSQTALAVSACAHSACPKEALPHCDLQQTCMHEMRAAMFLQQCGPAPLQRSGKARQQARLATAARWLLASSDAPTAAELQPRFGAFCEFSAFLTSRAAGRHTTLGSSAHARSHGRRAVRAFESPSSRTIPLLSSSQSSARLRVSSASLPPAGPVDFQRSCHR